MSVTSWFLVSTSGTRHRLPRELIFVGREDCELMLQSRSVDKQHAVINYDKGTDRHLLKDLGSLNGTFVNDQRIPDQTYITLKLSDVIRFGYDSQVYVLEKSQHKVPEEALKHEKYTSQLQMTITPSEERRLGEADGPNPHRGIVELAEHKVASEAPTSRPTPLYGQPSWWGEDDAGNKEQLTDEHQYNEDNSKEGSRMPEINCPDYQESQDDCVYSYRREPSYFEIPTKEFQTHPKSHETELHEIPTKDTDGPPLTSTITATPPVVQSHASFTIEFDDCTPGKMKIKDHVTKFSMRQHKPPGKQLTHTPSEVMSAESKVADWLVSSSNVSMMGQKNPSEDVCSTKSDLAMHIKTLKGHQHEDGTQSDSEDTVLKQKSVKSHNLVRSQPSVQLQHSVRPQQLLPTKFTIPLSVVSKQTQSSSETQSPQEDKGKAAPQELFTQQAFIIEFFDDNPRKKRSQSFTHNSAHADSYSALKAKLEKRKGGVQGGERPTGSSAQIPATQQVTVPLKGSGHSAPQRASSLKREKGEERLSSSSSCSNFSSRSTSAISIRPFGSVGRTSKLAQDFAAEFLKESDSGVLPTKEISPPPMSAPPVMIASSHIPASPSPPTTPNPPPATKLPPTPDYALSLSNTPPQCASPAQVSAAPPLFPVGVHSIDPKASKAVRTEEEDSLSDAGTYTIETEGPDKEVEEARNMIDQVFGVLDSPEYADVTPRVLRPIIDKDQDQRSIHYQSQSSTVGLKVAIDHHLNSAAVSDGLASQSQVHPACSSALGASRWVSQWASLADSYKESGPTAGPVDSLPQEELTSADRHIKATLSQSVDNTDVDNNQGSRTRRLLPQVPLKEKMQSPAPSIFIQHEPSTDCNASEEGSVKPHQQEIRKLHPQDDLDPDSLSDASKSDECSIVERNKENQARRNQEKTEHVGREQGKAGSSVKSTSFYIGSEEIYSKKDLAPVLLQTRREQDGPPRTSSTAVLTRANREPRRAVRPVASAPSLHSQGSDAQLKKEPSVFLVRQESFTKDGPSDDIAISRLPHISSQPALSTVEHGELYKSPSLSEVERKHVGSSSHAGNSQSGESDVDTGSTVSLISNKNATPAPGNKLTCSVQQKEKFSSSSPVQVPVIRQPTARERLSEKRRAHIPDTNGKVEPNKHLQLRRSAGNRGSLDFSDEQQSLTRNWPETASSDYESGSHLAMRKRLSAAPQKDASKGVVHQVLTRSNSLSSPRPTRASMLRRARLGEASDTEGAETDRASQGSDVNQPTKAPTDNKKLSRLDVLALPRKRTGSFTVASDVESASRADSFSRTSEVSASTRKAATTEQKPGTGKVPRAVPRPPISRTRSSSAKHSSTTGSRRQQKGSDYSSTSEEEYDAPGGPIKHKRSHASAVTQTLHTTKAAPVQSKARNADTAVDSETSSFQHWSTHSAEIARLSQDLAKDLAMLAQEIHDVAGEADSGMGTNTSPGSVPNTPASTISAREERTHASLQATRLSQLIQHIPEASLNYQKVPPGAAGVRDTDPNMNDEDLNSKRRLWNREEVILDNLMLNPVSQLSLAIRENTEQLAEKMKALFHSRTEAWEEIEAKIKAENEVPILKTSNKEITSILKELRRVYKQLEVINTIIEPGRSPDLLSKGDKHPSSSQPPSDCQQDDRTSASSAKVKNSNEVPRKSRAGAGSHSFVD